MFQTKVVQQNKYAFYVHSPPPSKKKSYHLWVNAEKYFRARQATDDF
jgi:hypothetical protein